MINVKLRVWSSKNKELFETIDWTEFQKVWPMATAEEKPKDFYLVGDGPCRLTYEEANSLVTLGFEVDLEPLPGAMVTKMQDDPSKKWLYGEEATPADLTSGGAVQITIPDLALMFIDEVDHLDDCCTDELQKWLNEGWRILAVCPPNAQRRPDYIIGRRKRDG